MTAPPLSLSLNETDALCREAARGAGLPWGLAEEAGKAVRSLARHRLDIIPAFLRALAHVDVAGACPPECRGRVWSAGEPISALVLGPAWSDCARLIAERGAEAGAVVEPLLLFPFLVDCARRERRALLLFIDGQPAIAAAASGSGAVAVAVAREAPPARAKMLRVVGFDDFEACLGGARELGVAHDWMAGRDARVRVSASDYKALVGFASRCYAPETEHSRASGAGAGLDDND